ncbi:MULTISPECIES: cupin domain-containing protein [Gemella]|uniref:hypothetical protein n=1 Tax=Gemella TaxID=1378 RepID=UPI0007684153|nr:MULTISPECIES: hypothetical protein [Gemella]AME09007.1 hypothetical protein AXE85_01935 [Gemella sp. oral taxon 928]AXI26579.1 hypothetical protein CG018_03705 [Gemella sp. ND 6198]
MRKVKLDKNALLGGIVLEHERYQVVHMNLKAGNQTDSYSNNKNILLFNISGKITVTFEETVEILNEFELLEVPAGVEHVITCLGDAQIFIVKL